MLGHLSARKGPCLKTEFAKSCTIYTPSPAAVLTRISMVGAKTTNAAIKPPGQYAVEDLSEYDLLYLELTLSELKNKRVSVNPDFELDVVNIEERFGGRDFLKETRPTDLLVISWVNNGNVPIHQHSDLHFVQNVWHDAAVRVGAKMISVISRSDTEVEPKAFKPFSGSLFEGFHERQDWPATGPDFLKRKDFQI